MLEGTRQLAFSLTQDANVVNSNRAEATRLLSQWEDEERTVKESFQHALRLQAEWDEQDSLAPQPQDFAVELFPPEEQRIAEEDHQQALRLQMEWDREETMISQQQKVAGDLARSDAQKLAELQADSKAAALLAQQWESEIKAQLDEMTRMASEFESAKGEAVRRHLNTQESGRLTSQSEFARGLAKAEEERNFQIQKNMEAATRAQKKWEIETQEQEAYARRIADEIARADAELARQEAQRLAEEEQRTRIEKDRIIKEDARRRQREAEVAKAEAQRRARQASCASCMEDLERTDMAMLPCNHWYCGECLSGAFQHALNSKVPFACCKITVSIALATRWLPHDIISAYNLFILELSTKKPVYCSNRSCAKFVPPQHVTGPVATCPLCRTRTCSACSNAEHSGVCAEDKEGLATLKLATKKGWKQCPHCGFILNKTEGCLHMTCRCRAEWCYSCLRDWGSCNSTCKR
ncbi:hypothetical protein B0O99DRAFT_503957 [Bisporella sp. PMI_857]|nr:hypothetical protein B0O99DRAFT_503957 [Bisporella sp. PMI_857]